MQRWKGEDEVGSSLVEFRSPEPVEVGVMEAGKLAAAMRELLVARLKSTVVSTVVHMRLDVFKYLFPFSSFSTHRLSLVPLSDFNPRFFPPGRHGYRSPTGDGFYADVIFMKPRLKTKPMHAPSPQDSNTYEPVCGTTIYQEVVSFKIHKKTF